MHYFEQQSETIEHLSSPHTRVNSYFTMKLTDFNLRTLLLNLGSDRRISTDDFRLNYQVENVLKFRNPLRILFKIKKCISHRRNFEGKFLKISAEELIDLILFLFISYITVKLILFAILHFQYDSILENLHDPLVRVGANRTKDCAFKNDLYFNYERDYERKRRIINLQEWLEWFGDPMQNLSGSSGTLCIILATYSFSFFLFGLIKYGIKSKNQTIQIDYLGFLRNPENTRNLIKNDIEQIVTELMKTTLNYVKNFEAKMIGKMNIDRQKIIWINTRKNRETKTEKNYKNNEQQLNKKSFTNFGEKINYSFSQSNSMFFINILLKNQLLVEPANLTFHWHEILIYVNKLILIGGTLFWLLSGLSVGLLVMINEIITRTNHRIRLAACLNWSKNGTLIRDDIYLGELNSAEDLLQFMAYNETTSTNYLELVFLEAKSYFRPLVILVIIELLLTITLVSSWVSFYFELFFTTHIDKLRWLNQISQQIDHCIRFIIQESEKEEQNNNNNNNNLNVNKDLFDSLTITMLNFECFRRKQHQYQLSANFMLIQASLVAGVTLISCYMVEYNISRGNNYLLLIASLYGTSFMNFYLVNTGLLMNRVKEIMKSIAKLNAHVAKIPIMHSSLLDIWRRQAMSEMEARRVFAPSLFGLHLSIDKLVPFNLYLVGVWLVLSGFGKN